MSSVKPLCKSTELKRCIATDRRWKRKQVCRSSPERLPNLRPFIIIIIIIIIKGLFVFLLLGHFCTIIRPRLIMLDSNYFFLDSAKNIVFASELFLETLYTSAMTYLVEAPLNLVRK